MSEVPVSDERYVTLSSRVAYQGEIVAVHEEDLQLPDGTVVGREMVIHPGAVGIVAVTPAGDVVLVEQYRQPVKQTLLEIPAGKLSLGEPPDECAMRELAEETGYTTGSLVKMGEFFTTPGFSNERFHMYLATDLTAGDPQPEAHEEEHMTIVEIPLAQALADAREGRIQDGKTLIGILLAHSRLG